jgi:lambda repressor-like predicted transcriptional regulator
MHPEDIKASLKKKGSSGAQIARQLTVSRSTVSEVISGRTKSRRIARTISLAVGISVSQLWPGKYPDLEHRPVRRAA